MDLGRSTRWTLYGPRGRPRHRTVENAALRGKRCFSAGSARPASNQRCRQICESCLCRGCRRAHPCASSQKYFSGLPSHERLTE